MRRRNADCYSWKADKKTSKAQRKRESSTRRVAQITSSPPIRSTRSVGNTSTTTGERALQLSQCLLPPVFIGPFPLGHLDLGVARLIDHRYAALCLNTREIRGPLPGVGYSGFCSSLVLLCVLLLRLAASVVSMTVGPFSAFITQC